MNGWLLMVWKVTEWTATEVTNNDIRTMFHGATTQCRLSNTDVKHQQCSIIYRPVVVFLWHPLGISKYCHTCDISLHILTSWKILSVIKSFCNGKQNNLYVWRKFKVLQSMKSFGTKKKPSGFCVGPNSELNQPYSKLWRTVTALLKKCVKVKINEE